MLEENTHRLLAPYSSYSPTKQLAAQSCHAPYQRFSTRAAKGRQQTSLYLLPCPAAGKVLPNPLAGTATPRAN